MMKKFKKENGRNIQLEIYKEILECPKCHKFLHFQFFANNCICKCGYSFSPSLKKDATKAFTDYIKTMRELKIKDMEVSYHGE